MISGNKTAGVLAKLLTYSAISRNFIGVGPDGSSPVPNGTGISLTDGIFIDIGGVPPALPNVISGNKNDQAYITEDPDIIPFICPCGPPPNLVTVRGNYIGLNAAGTAAVQPIVPNTANGVRVLESFGIVVGGDDPGEGNVISGNGGDGVTIVGDNSSEIEVSGNRIGTNGGLAAVPNLRDGVSLVPNGSGNGPHKTIIGSETPGTGNVISGNGRHGIRARKTKQETIIFHNLIGVDATGGGSIPNTRDGVLIDNSSRLIVQENTIANNGQAGLVMMPRASADLGNVVTLNSIFANVQLGIDLTDATNANGTGDGITLNTPGASTNFPVLATAETSGVATVVGGSLNASANTSYRVELFSSPACDPAGNGEGRAFLGGIDVGTDALGNATFSRSLPPIPSGQVITATASDPLQQTSEFSACKPVTTAAILVTPTSGLTTTELGGTATFTVALSTLPIADVKIGLSSSKPLEASVRSTLLTFTPGERADATTGHGHRSARHRGRRQPDLQHRDGGRRLHRSDLQRHGRPRRGRRQ